MTYSKNTVTNKIMNDRQPFDWINEESITFLRRGYLSEGEEPLDRIRIIANHAEHLLGIEGFADKFYGYMSILNQFCLHKLKLVK